MRNQCSVESLQAIVDARGLVSHQDHLPQADFGDEDVYDVGDRHICSEVQGMRRAVRNVRYVHERDLDSIRDVDKAE